jgi:hypothetical protein
MLLIFVPQSAVPEVEMMSALVNVPFAKVPVRHLRVNSSCHIFR